MKDQMAITSEQLIQIIGLKEVELMITKTKNQELMQLIQKKEAEEKKEK